MGKELEMSQWIKDNGDNSDSSKLENGDTFTHYQPFILVKNNEDLVRQSGNGKNSRMLRYWYRDKIIKR